MTDLSDPSSPFHHVTVMGPEVLLGLSLKDDGHYLDATVGGGGHSELILNQNPTVRITALDQDGDALAAAQKRLEPFGDRIQFLQTNFATFQPQTNDFAGIVADLGVSSVQLDQGNRGFSFRQDAPLDMRMDPRQTKTAAGIINHASETELADIFYHYGEERFSRRIARRIVQKRPLTTTLELANLVLGAIPGATAGRRHRIHPATRVFQALRIAVNDEIKTLETFLDRSPDWLLPEGRLCIISFHSLEDRPVKYKFRADSRLTIITKKPLTPTEQEQTENGRSRSAKLRIAEKQT
jgi:16S rRNA (cytosine1402-N4)-methyltransferase